MWRKLLISILLLSTPAIANGAAPEICGNGIDDVLATGGAANGTRGSCPANFMDTTNATISNSCDRKCPGIDVDDDGYNSDGTIGTAGLAYKDCDDNARDIRPLEYTAKGCSAGNFRQCLTNGTYSACTPDPLCEATGTGVCKYIDFTSGNDSNAGTFASPYLTWGKVAGGSPGSPPASPYSLNPGDVVYIKGAGASTATYNDGTRVVLINLTRAGTLANPITIKQYPGAIASASNTGGVGVYFSSTAVYTNVKGVILATDRGATNNGSAFLLLQSNNNEISDNYVSSMTGHGDNNDACIYANNTHDTYIHHNYLKDCKMGTGNADNLSAIKILDDTGSAAGANHRIKWNTEWWSTYSATNNGACFHQKHGTTLAETGANGLQYAYNSCVNYRNGLRLVGAGVRATYNTFWSDPVAENGRIFDDSATGVNNAGIRIQYNAFLSGSMIHWNWPYYSGAESILFDHNVVVDTDSAYAAGNNEGVLSMDGYGSDAQKTTFESGTYLAANFNCYYCPNATCVFSYFGDNSGAGHGPSGPSGGNYSFATWQSVTVTPRQDQSSFMENPNLDSNQEAQAAHCITFGRVHATSGTGGGSSVTNPMLMGTN